MLTYADVGAAVEHARAESVAQFLRGVLEAHGPDLQALLLYADVCCCMLTYADVC
jgi:hypothetical protein